MPKDKLWYVIASARGLQDYILRSPRLVDMVGASELIEWLAGDLGDEVLQCLMQDPSKGVKHVVGKSAGTLRLVFEQEDPARDFVHLWPFVCDRVAPGLEVVCGIGSIGSGDSKAIRDIEGQIETNRNRRHVRLPLGSLATLWNSKTGKSASGSFPKEDEEEGERPDFETAAKRRAANDGHERLLKRCISPSHFSKGNRFARDLNEFGTGESSYLGLIHIDTNGLGLRFQKLAKRLSEAGDNSDWLDEWKRLFVDTSEALAKATQQAVQDSLAPILDRLATEDLAELPIRPLVCAGDDLTLIVRADLAMEFTRSYLLNLPKIFAKLSAGLPVEFTATPLTAAAGIVFVPVKFPFYDAYDACERLVSQTKASTARQVSGVSFIRLTEPNPDSTLFPETLLEDQSTVLRQTLCPYTLEGDFARLDDLAALVQSLPDLVSPGLREFPRPRRTTFADLDSQFARICEVLEDHSPGSASTLRDRLSRLTGQGTPGTGGRCYARTVQGACGSPIRDALELLHLGVQITPVETTTATSKS